MLRFREPLSYAHAPRSMRTISGNTADGCIYCAAPPIDVLRVRQRHPVRTYSSVGIVLPAAVFRSLRLRTQVSSHSKDEPGSHDLRTAFRAARTRWEVQRDHITERQTGHPSSAADRAHPTPVGGLVTSGRQQDIVVYTASCSTLCSSIATARPT